MSSRVLYRILATAELLLRWAGISALITTNGFVVEQGGRTWREIGRSEVWPHSGERTYWGFGLYAIAVNTKLSQRLLACPVRQAARSAKREADHASLMAEYAN